MSLNVLVLNITAASAMLLFTSYLDVRKREVEDKVWLIFGALGLILEGYEIINGSTGILDLVISVGLAGAVGLGIFFFGLYGGADAKALIVLAVILPTFHPSVGIYRITPLMVLTNGILLSMGLPAALLILNLVRVARGEKIFAGFNESIGRRLLACFLGYRSNGRPRQFQFRMEKEVAPANSTVIQKKFDFSFMQDEFESRPGTWVTPGLPLLVFFTIGFFVLLLYGDLVIGLVSFITKLL